MLELGLTKGPIPKGWTLAKLAELPVAKAQQLLDDWRRELAALGGKWWMYHSCMRTMRAQHPLCDPPAV